MDNESALLWSAPDFSRVPYAVFDDGKLYGREPQPGRSCLLGTTSGHLKSWRCSICRMHLE